MLHTIEDSAIECTVEEAEEGSYRDIPSADNRKRSLRARESFDDAWLGSHSNRFGSSVEINALLPLD